MEEIACLGKWPVKGIVHPKIKIWCLSAYPQGIQDVGEFVSSVEHKQRFLTVSKSFFTSDPPQCPTVLSTFTTAGVWRVNVLWHSRRLRGSDLKIRFGSDLKNLCLCSTEETVGCCERAQDSWTLRWIRGKNYINTVQFLAQTDCFVS